MLVCGLDKRIVVNFEEINNVDWRRDSNTTMEFEKTCHVQENASKTKKEQVCFGIKFKSKIIK